MRRYKTIKTYLIKRLTGELVYVAPTKKVAQEVLVDIIIRDHFEHFYSWCKLHNYNFNEREVMEKYIIDCDLNEKFCIETGKIDSRHIASLQRIVYGVEPLLRADYEPFYEFTLFFEKELEKVNDALSDDSQPLNSDNLANLDCFGEEALDKIKTALKESDGKDESSVQ